MINFLKKHKAGIATSVAVGVGLGALGAFVFTTMIGGILINRGRAFNISDLNHIYIAFLFRLV